MVGDISQSEFVERNVDLVREPGVGERVVWAGARPDVEGFYGAADLVALPTRYEPFGNVHLEALAAGLPVLASARSGGAEVMSYGQTGWILDDPEDPEAIAQGLETLRESGPVRLAEATRRAVAPFTFSAQVQAFTALYRSL